MLRAGEQASKRCRSCSLCILVGSSPTLRCTTTARSSFMRGAGFGTARTCWSMTIMVPLMMRLPIDLHCQLAQDASKAHRSVNAEIVWRLEQGYLNARSGDSSSKVEQQTIAKESPRRAWRDPLACMDVACG